MSAFDYADLFRHRGHKIVCVSYGQYNDPENVAIECETCNEVLLDYDRPAYPDKHRSGAIRDKKMIFDRECAVQDKVNRKFLKLLKKFMNTEDGKKIYAEWLETLKEGKNEN